MGSDSDSESGSGSGSGSGSDSGSDCSDAGSYSSSECSFDRNVPDTDGKMHVYLVGNSYTRNNDLRKLTALALQASETQAHVDSYNPPGQPFSGHLSDLKGEGRKGDQNRLHLAMTKNQNRQWNWLILRKFGLNLM